MYMYWLLSIKVRLYANTCTHTYVWFCCWCLLLHGRCQICPKQLVVWMYLFWSFEKQRSFQLKACMKAFNLWHTVMWLCISKWEARWPNGAGLCIESSRSKKWSGSLCCGLWQNALLSHCYSRWTSILSRARGLSRDAPGDLIPLRLAVV